MLNVVYRTAAVSIVAGATLATILTAQSSSAPPAASPDAVVAEIKALRADLNQRLDASIRAQLLVARLQVQEQRVATLSRQLTDVQQQLQNNDRARAPIEGQLKVFEEAHETDPEKKKEGNFFLTLLRSQLDVMSKTDDDLKRQQAYLSGLIADEQSRWTAFNDRLEELERLLTPTPAPRR